MKQQIVVIHGGTSFRAYDDYVSFLENKELTLDRLRPSRDWKDALAEELGDKYDVLLPKMPNKTNARYKEWQIWFERIVPLLNKEVVLIGHSMGGVFLAKYLSENNIQKTIKATILVAALFKNKGERGSYVRFALPSSLSKFAKQGGDIYLFHSKDDHVVPFGAVKKYKQALPDAEMMTFEDRGHFNQERFPEIVELIKKF